MLKYRTKGQSLSEIDPRLDDSIKWPEDMPWSFRLRGIVFALFFLLTAMFGIVPLHYIPMPFLKLISEDLWRKWAAFAANTW
jgi:hypothetical protein